MGTPRVERPDPSRRLTVVWPLPSPYGGLSTLHPGSDPFADELFAQEALAGLPDTRPQSRADCVGRPRPCPWVSCRYNLYLDVREDGVLKLNFPDKEPDEMTASCALDLAEDGPRTLDGIAAIMGMSKERARQLEAKGFEKMRDRLPRVDAFAQIDDDDWV